MQKINKKVFLTRIISEDLIEKASLKDINITCIPFISIEHIANEPLRKEISHMGNKEYHVILTSVHAVHALSSFLGDHKPNWKFYCIGPITSRVVAEFFGKDNIIVSESFASNLGEIIVQQYNDRSFLFFCGDKRLNTLPEMLQNAGIDLREFTIYKNIATPHIINEHYDGVGFFSPSAVESFFSMNPPQEIAEYFSIGPTTSAAIMRFTKNQIIESNDTSQEEMVETIINHYNNQKIDTIL